jgi:hypothetical protein
MSKPQWRAHRAQVCDQAGQALQVHGGLLHLHVSDAQYGGFEQRLQLPSLPQALRPFDPSLKRAFARAF